MVFLSYKLKKKSIRSHKVGFLIKIIKNYKTKSNCMAKHIIKVFGLDPLLPLLGTAILTYKYPPLSAVWILVFWAVVFRKSEKS